MDIVCSKSDVTTSIFSLIKKSHISSMVPRDSEDVTRSRRFLLSAHP